MHMNRNDALYTTYCDILRQELIPATGCTEPIALAYCAAKARAVLGRRPEKLVIDVSGNIIKNVKSVIVPCTGGMKGIPAAAAAGVIAGREEEALQVLSSVSDGQKAEIRAYLEKTPISVSPMESPWPLDIAVTAVAGEDSAYVRLNRTHTHIEIIRRNGEVLFTGEAPEKEEAEGPDHRLLNVRDILAFADCLDPEDVREVLDRQIACNTAIAEEGLRGGWGASVGSILLKTEGNTLRTRAKALPAAGSDARMSGCELPVVINSGSGNQGLTVSLPVIEYFRASGLPQDRLYRALAVSNLCAVHEKTALGTLSAYCGAVTAGSAAAAGIAYLLHGDFASVAHAIVNALAVTSGIVCDGAKPSCAAKIAVSVEAGIFGLEMYENGCQFYGGDGILSKGVENTIANVGRLGSEGMQETDRKILEIMTQELRG